MVHKGEREREIEREREKKNMAVTSVGGQVWVKKSQKISSFMFQCCLFFLIFGFFCLSLSSLPLLLDIFKPKNGPPNEVLGK